jgi:ketosteroid isomerase-like protein
MAHDDIDALADRFFDAIEAGDVATIDEIYAPDVTVWHNFTQTDQARSDNLAVLGWIIKRTKERRYTDRRRTCDGEGFVQQHVLRATASSGAELCMPAMMRVTVRDGHIARIEEYLDPAQATALQGS